MLIARLVFGLALVAAVLSFAMYAGTGAPHWRALGLRLLKWTLVAGLGFFAVLLLEELVLIL